MKEKFEKLPSGERVYQANEFEVRSQRTKRGSHSCEVFLPHISTVIPAMLFNVKSIETLIKGLKDISTKHNLPGITMDDFTDKTKIAEALYADMSALRIKIFGNGI